VLFHFDKCSQAETAAIMEISEGAVKKHLDLARRRLRTELGADWS
jgi:DNA-directed RNA polymerase specialized sigma24 family protein